MCVHRCVTLPPPNEIRPTLIHSEESSMKRILLGALVLLGATTVVAVEPPRLDYPKTHKGDQTDDYHGTKVADPYRWLEDDVRKSKDVANWVEAENKVTFDYLK